ncbi:MAG TPA: glycosyltransferase family 2 protein [Dokdonella sp.]|uniref:glycosyltransferase family 2 protein n=1 Tax=Dokdonella sp. TaxID=2291710 RepID=UPI002D7E6CC8|nr:glycosyltransferase family 2 protein [Dokdonella sp.]HET9032415.1 glycosyltransferase family 2 protein [Dokdonella sp.]
MHGLTSVIVVTANSGALSVECIDRVLKSSATIELIVVDNASSDGHTEAIESRFGRDERLRILRSPQNIGFGPACNQGRAHARGDWLLILNPDCLLETDTIERLRAAALDEPQAGLFGVRVVDPRGNGEKASRRRDPTLRRALNTLSGLSRLERRWPGLAGIEMPQLATGTEHEAVDAVSGACLFVRAEVFDAVGGFDEEYFLHCEDLDLCRRIRDAGFEVVHVPSIALRHEQGSSSQRRPLFVSRHKHRGMWRYFRKFDPAARNPILRGLVWSGIWTHFLIKALGNGWKQWRRNSIAIREK